jgi:predicted heme/steroid binding protein
VPLERLEDALAEELAQIRVWRRAAGEAASASGAGRSLLERATWLRAGTPARVVERLHPVRDADQIHHHLLESFAVEARIVETLAINRVACWEPLALFLRSTGEAEQRPQKRFVDTYALFANYFEWGEHSPRGRSAVERMNQIHGRYYIPNEGMRYVLSNTAFTWLDGVDRIGHRPLTRVERLGFFHAYRRLARALGIRGVCADHDRELEWFRSKNRDNAQPRSTKAQTFETFVKNSLAGSREHWESFRLALCCAMDDDYLSALGYVPPSAAQLAAVRGVVRRLAGEAARQSSGACVRSLAMASSGPPAQLGVAARSERLPALDPSKPNAGFPEGQSPVGDRAAVEPAEVPTYTFRAIRERVAAGEQWLVIDGGVYDVASFAQHHPGGAERLRAFVGRDASRAFRAAGHGRLTEVLRLNYRVGRLSPADRLAGR